MCGGPRTRGIAAHREPEIRPKKLFGFGTPEAKSTGTSTSTGFKIFGGNVLVCVNDIEQAGIDRSATKRTTARYSRLAPVYDAIEAPMELMGTRQFRARLFGRVAPGRILEIGVGTGKNLPFYPDEAQITAVDISPAMLHRASARRLRLSAFRRYSVRLIEADAQSMPFADETFDTVVGTFVFCSVPDPVLGLAEARRVTKREGHLILLEHVRPGNPVLGRVFDTFNPVMKRLMGPEINRRTVENIRRAGWTITAEENLVSDVVKLVAAVRGAE